MSVKLNTRQVGDVTVIDVSGRITLGEGSSALRDALRIYSLEAEITTDHQNLCGSRNFVLAVTQA